MGGGSRDQGLENCSGGVRRKGDTPNGHGTPGRVLAGPRPADRLRVLLPLSDGWCPRESSLGPGPQLVTSPTTDIHLPAHSGARTAAHPTWAVASSILPASLGPDYFLESPGPDPD